MHTLHPRHKLWKRHALRNHHELAACNQLSTDNNIQWLVHWLVQLNYIIGVQLREVTESVSSQLLAKG